MGPVVAFLFHPEIRETSNKWFKPLILMIYSDFIFDLLSIYPVDHKEMV